MTTQEIIKKVDEFLTFDTNYVPEIIDITPSHRQYIYYIIFDIKNDVCNWQITLQNF